MILLIGPTSWAQRVKRELEAHTTHDRRVLLASTAKERLRTTREWTEVIVFTDMSVDWEPTLYDLEVMDMADTKNTKFIENRFRG